ncbi:hypothetical protein B0H11DRAFT_1899692 [Mycena galericulata]|nr:hypothetical protein B0H11DRAFT_1899692 [Mycena galericulata]
MGGQFFLSKTFHSALKDTEGQITPVIWLIGVYLNLSRTHIHDGPYASSSREIQIGSTSDVLNARSQSRAQSQKVLTNATTQQQGYKVIGYLSSRTRRIVDRPRHVDFGPRLGKVGDIRTREYMAAEWTDRRRDRTYMDEGDLPKNPVRYGAQLRRAYWIPKDTRREERNSRWDRGRSAVGHFFAARNTKYYSVGGGDREDARLKRFSSLSREEDLHVPERFVMYLNAARIEPTPHESPKPDKNSTQPLQQRDIRNPPLSGSLDAPGTFRPATTQCQGGGGEGDSRGVFNGEAVVE